MRIYLRVRAPSIYQANADELAQITVSAISYKDPAIRSDRLTLTLMDVVHGIELATSHTQSDVEQGQTAIFSITITNTGNVFDTFAFYDPTSLQGQQEWLLPWGWQINFPLTVKEIQAVVFFKELEPDGWRVSLRSKGDIDINAVAKQFDGGGHKNASGCSVLGRLADLKAVFEQKIIDQIERTAGRRP